MPVEAIVAIIVLCTLSVIAMPLAIIYAKKVLKRNKENIQKMEDFLKKD